MGDQSKSDIATHEVLQEINSRSEMNPEFQEITRMPSAPETDGEPNIVIEMTKHI